MLIPLPTWSWGTLGEGGTWNGQTSIHPPPQWRKGPRWLSEGCGDGLRVPRWMLTGAHTVADRWRMRKVCFLKPQLHTRLELTEDMNVSVGEPHSRTSFKTESETSSFVSIYCKRDMLPFPYLTHAHTELLSHKVSSKTLRVRTTKTRPYKMITRSL